jgi:hypothetical protein
MARTSKTVDNFRRQCNHWARTIVGQLAHGLELTRLVRIVFENDVTLSVLKVSQADEHNVACDA